MILHFLYLSQKSKRLDQLTQKKHDSQEYPELQFKAQINKVFLCPRIKTCKCVFAT